MVLQLWRVGRMSHPLFQPGGVLPVTPSAIKPGNGALEARARRSAAVVRCGQVPPLIITASLQQVLNILFTTMEIVLA
jgi:hypothetical protein